MDKKKVFILSAVCLCVIMFAVELSLIESDTAGGKSLAQVKSTFEEDIQELKNGKYENLIATDFVASIEEVEKVYDLQILFPESYKELTFLENYTLVLEDGLSLEEQNTLEVLWNQSYKDREMQENLEVINQVIDTFFQTEVDKSYLEVDYWIEEENIEIEYNEFKSSLAQGLTCTGNLFSVFGNDTSNGGYMIQINSSLNGTWFSRGELGDIMPSLNDCRAVYPYLSGKRQVEDAVLHLLDGDILLSEMEEKVMEYLNTDAFPLPQTEGIHYEIGEARVLENGENDGVCFMVRRVYEGVPFEYGLFGNSYECDKSEISYARGEVPDTMRAFFGIDGEVIEIQAIKHMISAGEALEILSNYLGNNNGLYEIRGVELVYINCNVSSEEAMKISDILEPKWKFIVCSDGSGKEITYFIDVVTGEIG